MSKTVEDNFILIKKGKRRKHLLNNGNKTEELLEHEEILSAEEIVIREESILKRLDILCSEIKSTQFFRTALESLKTAIKLTKHQKIEKLVCFGLGAFSKCPSALHQLAFILEIRKYLYIKSSKFYDPILTSYEKTILLKLNCELIEENCEGKYPIECVTIFYFPHCPKQLTNNFLWKNWEKEQLKNSILICNSFESLQRNTPERFLKKDAEYILRILDYTNELNLENNYHFSDVFNDFSIHLFLGEKLELLGNEFWLKGAEPNYDDSELITNDFLRKLSIK